MSKTPKEFAQKCHDKIMDYDPPRYSDIVKVIRAMQDRLEKTEAENERMAKQCVKNVEEIGTLRVELKRAEKLASTRDTILKHWKEDEGADAKRFAFIVSGGNGQPVLTCSNGEALPLDISRESIDAAMKEAQA